MTHPTLYPARQRREWTSDPATGHPVAHLRVDLGSAENEARAALAAFYNALTYTTSYFGWPTTVVDALTTPIDDSIPTFFVCTFPGRDSQIQRPPFGDTLCLH